MLKTSLAVVVVAMLGGSLWLYASGSCCGREKSPAAPASAAPVSAASPCCAAEKSPAKPVSAAASCCDAEKSKAAPTAAAASCCEETPATRPSTQPSTQPSEAPVNKKCPVMKEDIDPKVTLMYKGKKIGFCCDSCIPEFKKDPEKYMKDLK